jgi:acetolactate synthase small subunit
MQAVGAEGGKVLSVCESAAILEFTGDTERIDHLIANTQGILELCRTGVTALQTGATTLTKANKFWEE